MIDGTEYGPRFCEIGNWVGKAVYSPRVTISSGSTELWKTDGTTAGTVKLKDMSFIPNFSVGTGNIWPSGNVLYFYGADATNGAELWKTDGTANGTQMVADYSKGIDNSGLSEGFGINGKLIYGADSASNGGGL